MILDKTKREQNLDRIRKRIEMLPEEMTILMMIWTIWIFDQGRVTKVVIMDLRS